MNTKATSAPADTGRELQRLVRDFRRLSRRFPEHVRRARKLGHLNMNLAATAVQASRLLVSAIDDGAFPESARDRNGGWWDRSKGRVPGGPVTVEGTIRWSVGEPLPEQQPRFLAAASAPFDDAQYRRCWMMTISSWLTKAFPDRFRPGAAEWGWSHVAYDKDRRPLGRDKKPLKSRWYRNGRPLPRTFKGPRPGDVGRYQWRLGGPALRVEELYDEDDWFADLGIRAEIYSDACLLLSDLIRPASHKGDPAELPIEYVTRSQAAAIVNRSPRTFEHRRDMPKPAIRGGAGRASEWDWAELRPWLAQAFGRRLPVRFPTDRFTRK